VREREREREKTPKGKEKKNKIAEPTTCNEQHTTAQREGEINGETMMTKMKKRSRVASIVDQWPLARRTRTIAEHNMDRGQKLNEVYESAQSTKEGRRIVVTLKYAARTIHTEICPSSFGLPPFLPSFLPPFGFSTPFSLFTILFIYLFIYLLFFLIQLHHKSFFLLNFVK
jgi:hypothetical protein